MKLVPKALIIVVTSAGFAYAVLPAQTAPPNPLVPRVARLEKQVKLQRGQIQSLTAESTQLFMDFQNAVQAESNLEARVSALEQKVGR
jgi:hypothetical protein